MLVLIVEDNLLLARDAADSLERAGYRTRLARSLADPLPLRPGERPAVALVDLGLADGLTGAEVARRLLALGVPVVAISGYGREVVADVLAGVAVFGLLTKPVPPPLLVATVRRAIEAAGDAAPAP